MHEFLTKLIERKKAEAADLQKRSDESQDLAEVRAIGETLKKLADEIAEAEAQLAELDADNGTDDGGAADDGQRSVIPEGAELRNAQVVGAFNLGGSDNMHNTENNLQYRNAFMEYVLRGTPIPAELRANENTVTGDVGSVIPTHLVTQIIRSPVMTILLRMCFRVGDASSAISSSERIHRLISLES